MTERRYPPRLEPPESCDACDFETAALTRYPARDPVNEEDNWLCGLCAGTHSGSRHHTNLRPVLNAICYVGNHILAKLEAPND